MNQVTRAPWWLVVSLGLASGCLDLSKDDCTKSGSCQADPKPTIAASTPAANATGVPLNTGLSLSFSQAMIRSSVQLSITPVVGLTGPTWVEDGTDTTLAYVFAGPLTAATQYTVTVSGQSAKGVPLDSPTQLFFTTGAVADTGAPEVVSTFPQDATTGVSTDSVISVSFSEPMQVSAASAVSVSPLLPCAFTWDAEGKVLTCTHASQPMTANTAYTVTVGAQAADVAGNALAEGLAFSFKTALPPDLTQPTVATIPPNGAVNVPVDIDLVLTFSESMDPSTLSIVSQPAFDWGAPAWSNADKTATFSAPPGLLKGATTYFMTLSASDRAGNPLTVATQGLSFTTQATPDATAPTVVQTVPADGQQDVSTSSNVSIVFSEKMGGSTTAALAFTGAESVPCTMALDGTLTVLTCQHEAQPFKSNTTYTLTVSTAAKDEAGNPLAAPLTFSFKTGAQPDLAPPDVASTSPVAGSLLVSPATSISVTFTEAMDQASTQTAFSVYSPATTGTFTWSGDLKTLTFTPSAAFAPGTTVSWKVTKTARDLSANPMAYDRYASFTTYREGTASVTAGVSDATLTSLPESSTCSGTTSDAASLSIGSFTAKTVVSVKRAQMTFVLPVLPAGAVVQAASLSVWGLTTTGTPFADRASHLGKLIVEELTDGKLSCVVCTTRCAFATLATEPFNGVRVSTSVLTDVGQAYASARSSISLRLRFSEDVVGASTTSSDSITIGSADNATAGYWPKLEVSYRY